MDGQMKDHDMELGASSVRKNAFFTTLVIDDKLTFAGFLEEFLKSEGHYIMRAVSAGEALEKTLEFQPDLILLSNELTGTNGLALLPELLIEQATASVIVMANKPSISEAVEAMKLGASDYLERPLDPKRLKVAIDMQKALFKA